MTADARILYEERLREIRDNIMREKDAESRGENIGENRAKIEIAKKMLKRGTDLIVIAEDTGLSLPIIQKLKKEINL